MTERLTFIDIDDDASWDAFRLKDVGLVDLLAADLPGRVKYLRRVTDGPLEHTLTGRLSIGVFDGEPTEEFWHEFPHDEIWLMLEGTGTVCVDHGETVALKPGRLVLMSRGLKARWQYTSSYRGIFIHLW